MNAENATQKAKKVLSDHGLSVTQTRVRLLDLFIKAKRPLSIYDFKKTKLFKDVNESSLYRNFDKFEEVGIIHSVPNAGEAKSYELKPEQGHHHHHIVCTSCEEVTCLTDCGLEERLENMAKKAGFALKGHYLELFGHCKGCAGP